VSVSVIIFRANSFPVAASRRTVRKATTEASKISPDRGIYEAVGVLRLNANTRHLSLAGAAAAGLGRFE